MDTPLEESNLAYIGSDQDKAARQAAAALEVHWEGAGETEGVEIWRVENTRNQHDVPVFGIHKWPTERHGEFYTGDSYIVLLTSKEHDKLVWDIFFWIGAHSTQDEYGVVSYKAQELDQLLGDAPVQHRLLEGHESSQFSEIFGGNIKVLDGGTEGGFRHVDADDSGGGMQIPTRLFRIHRAHHVTRSFQVPLSCDSLNDGDSFLLDAGNTIYTWFGSQSSPFEKERTAQMAHNLAKERHGHARVKVDVNDEENEFWNLLGGKGEIQALSPDDDEEEEEPIEFETKMYVLSDSGGNITISQVPADKNNLVSGDVCLIDAGSQVYVWIGKDSSKREHQVSMLVVEKHLKAMGRANTTTVTRVLEGQESRCRGFQNVL
mmetsp:Transcript_5913/g.10798  ORF Transcript_5913/g.10798 Transcript_5913/m.10798 type:complete len:376 (+) Transcript_5913:91-1218(+)